MTLMGKILEITQQIPTPAILEDGLYIGFWGGNIIEVKHRDKLYSMKTEEGVRGINIRVMIAVKNGVATYEEIKN